MCLGLATGYREPERKSLLKEDPTEKFKETVCDAICRFPREALSEDEFDDVCENCILNRVKKVELKEAERITYERL